MGAGKKKRRKRAKRERANKRHEKETQAKRYLYRPRQPHTNSRTHATYWAFVTRTSLGRALYGAAREKEEKEKETPLKDSQTA